MKLLDTAAKRAHAAQLFNDPLFNEIMDGMEAASINEAMYAKPTDDATRHAALTEARAIRSLRTKLKNLAVHSETHADKTA